MVSQCPCINPAPQAAPLLTALLSQTLRYFFSAAPDRQKVPWKKREKTLKKMFLQVVNAGPSSKLGVDNTTGCLPDVLQFCSPVAVGQNTDLTCPSVAFRRPAAAAVPNGTSRVGSPLVHLRVRGCPLACRGCPLVCKGVSTCM